MDATAPACRDMSAPTMCATICGSSSAKDLAIPTEDYTGEAVERSTAFWRRQTTVTGPTPPGTGTAIDAF